MGSWPPPPPEPPPPASSYPPPVYPPPPPGPPPKCTLLLKKVPASVKDQVLESLMSHLGASGQPRRMSATGRCRGMVFCDFPDLSALQLACQAMDGYCLGGTTIGAEISSPPGFRKTLPGHLQPQPPPPRPAAATSAAAPGAPPRLAVAGASSAPPPPSTGQQAHHTPAPPAPAPPPPRPDHTSLSHIVELLRLSPAFYQAVLRLMGDMGLPAAPRAQGAASRKECSSTTDQQETEQEAKQGEEEEDDDGTPPVEREHQPGTLLRLQGVAVVPIASGPSRPARAAGNPLLPLAFPAPPPPPPSPPHPYRLPKPKPPMGPQAMAAYARARRRDRRRRRPFEPKPLEVDVCRVGGQSYRCYPRPGVIGLSELERRRATDMGWLAGGRGDEGEGGTTLYVKNLAKGVQVSDLEYVFHAFAPPQGSMPRITHMTRGRMRRQAFVQYSCESWARSALGACHGLLLEGKPLVLAYATGQPPDPPPG